MGAQGAAPAGTEGIGVARMPVTGWWQELADLVLAARCAGCGAPRGGLCGRCRGGLAELRARRAGPLPGLPRAYAAGAYSDELRALLLAHKERGALRLARPLGQALAVAVRAVLAGPGSAARAGTEAGAAESGPVALVPVPSARRTVAARGHDPVRRLARAAAAGLSRAGAPARASAVLHQRRPVADQAGLTRHERHRNLAGALGVAPGAARLLGGAGAVVVVDDLLTTGASLTEAVRALGDAGVRCAGAAVVALAPRPGTAPWDGGGGHRA
ncbi:phosphoribosyltransferase family protein [Streptomyces sp. TRM70308]|uniref:ComF family protein n=1 Tax=Streptomyces sp. TRM70308 TaxID=3131932 RepID=UPI003D069495